MTLRRERYWAGRAVPFLGLLVFVLAGLSTVLLREDVVVSLGSSQTTLQSLSGALWRPGQNRSSLCGYGVGTSESSNAGSAGASASASQGVGSKAPTADNSATPATAATAANPAASAANAAAQVNGGGAAGSSGSGSGSGADVAARVGEVSPETAIAGKTPPAPQGVTPFLVARHLYSSGFDARTDVARLFVPRVYWTWSDATVNALKERYNGHFFDPELCQSKHAIYNLTWGDWGLFSEIRDTVDVLLAALLSKSPVLIGFQHWKCEEAGDPFMFCYFEPFSRCKTSDYPKSVRRTYIRRAFDVWKKPHLEDVWRDLLRHGLRLEQPSHVEPECEVPEHHETFGRCVELQVRQEELGGGVPTTGQAKEDWQRYQCSTQAKDLTFVILQSRMSVIRAIFFDIIFKPTHLLQARIDEVTQARASLPEPMLVVHLRRTDKKRDGAKLMKQETSHETKHTLFVVTRLIKAAERISKRSFGSLFVVSDDPHLLLDKDVTGILSRAGSKKPIVLVSRAGLDDHVDQEQLAKGGHETLKPHDRKIMNLALLADIFWAARRASHVVGNGKSAVSQALTQLMGARLKMDPNYLGLFEDDTTMLECLKETEDVAWLVEPEPSSP